jgi:DNA-binding NarL/FixJ family response regulator
MAQACGAMDDCDAATLELELACEVFKKLGAAPDLSRTKAISVQRVAKNENPLTVREIEVLKLIASGKTNRAIAGALNISEKTVARHVSNIFNKLDLPSRAAATAFAYENQIV